MASTFQENIKELLNKGLINRDQVSALYEHPRIDRELVETLKRIQDSAFQSKIDCAIANNRKPPKRKKESFYLDDILSTAAVALSMCINEDPHTTLANVIARYALMRRTTFASTASAVLDFYERNQESLPVFYGGNGVYYISRWTPLDAPETLPPIKHLRKKPSTAVILTGPFDVHQPQASSGDI